MKRIILLLILMSFCTINCKSQVTEPEKGKGYFNFTKTGFNNSKPIKVWYYVPETLNDNTPVLIVLHGVNRDAERYRDEWLELVQKYNSILLCPEFNADDFPDDANYNLGNMFERLENEEVSDPLPEGKWTFGIIEPIFDFVIAKYKLKTTQFSIYGHSAGAQFVHRLALYKPESKIKKVIPANAGWYTMPVFDIDFPYGLKNSECDTARLKQAFKLEVTVLLGEEDTNPNHSQLRRTPKAMKQGIHRLERGTNYFNTAKKMAEQLNTPFNWKLQTVPGVAHSDKKMAPAAAEIIFGK